MKDKGKIFGGSFGWFLGGPVGGLLGMVFGEFVDEKEEDQVSEHEYCYSILGIDSSASDDEVKKAYRRKALKYHPDKVLHRSKEDREWAEGWFKKITLAYERIKKERNLV